MEDEAVIALATANSFIEDIIGTMNRVGNDADFPNYAPELLNTVALAAKQIQKAEGIDATAVLSAELNDDTSRDFTIPQLKAILLLYEGMIQTQAGQYKKALPILEQAAKIDPSNPHAWHWLGLTNGHLFNKAAAVTAYNKAIELDPTNLDYRKNLERIKSISSAQQVAHGIGKTARTGFSAVMILQLLLAAGCIIYFIMSLQHKETYVGEYAVIALSTFGVWLFFGFLLAGLGKIFEWLS